VKQNKSPFQTPTTRREFLQSVGITFAVGSTGIVGSCSMESSSELNEPLPYNATNTISANAWVTINANDSIIIKYAGTEMGQGSMTTLPLVLAEELDADWKNVNVEIVSVHDPIYGNPIRYTYYGFPILYTAGSRTLEAYYPVMRQAGAQARKFLLDTAAAEWGVPVSELKTELSQVSHSASGNTLSYGQLISLAEVPKSFPLVNENEYKTHAEYRYLGKDITRIDVPGKSDGSALFGIDAQVPGMVYASVLRAPVEGEEPLNIDDSMAKTIEGVIDVITLPYGVAVVGETVEATFWGKNALEVTWSNNSPFRNVNQNETLDKYESHARDLTFTTDNPLWQEVGDIKPAFDSAENIVEAVYRADPAYHAQMEPMNATANVSEDGKSAEIWVSTQTQSLSIMAAADTLETSIDKITLHPMLIGGGYGRRGEYQAKYVDDALLVSRAIRKPVKVIWSREDDVKDGVFRPLSAQFMRAAINRDGKITALQQRVATPSVLSYYNVPRWNLAEGRDGISMNGAQTTRYDIPNILAEHLIMDRGSRVAAWRGVGSSYTRFANESFIDELAHREGADPLQFRIDLAKNDLDGKQVLEEVGLMSDWSRKRDGTALGVALSDYGGFSVAAGVAEVSVNNETGQIKVHNYWMVIDAGFLVAPRNVNAQMEGNIIMGLSNALKERISIKEGTVDQSNFHDYQVMRIDEMPDIHVKALKNTKSPSGVGELGLATTGAAVANAVFAATGARVRELPLTPDRVLAALRG
tara:strand:+ start:13958 stop:16222 length:2265 start_codon:yes stop_codon:yes gene_type:complete